MACFIVPAAEAVIVTAARKVIERKEKKENLLSVEEGNTTEVALEEGHVEHNFSHKMKWLSNLLWGGSVLLAFEHFWHGEISLFAPFLTAASNAADTKVMLNEMATVGTSMAVLITATWGVMLGVSKALENKANKETDPEEV